MKTECLILLFVIHNKHFVYVYKFLSLSHARVCVFCVFLCVFVYVCHFTDILPRNNKPLELGPTQENRYKTSGATVYAYFRSL